jgi:putative SOS response-associated peptidase YedK
MCGRYTLEFNDRFEQRFNIVESIPKLQSRYNIAPSQELPVIIDNKIKVMKWGLVPFWSKDGKDTIINVRSETAGIKPMFKKLLEFQRCLIPATGFFEWFHFAPTGHQGYVRDKSRIPYFFRLKSHDYFSFAGIYDKNTYAILTTTPNKLMTPIHNRMPVILKTDYEKNWGNPDNIGIDHFNSMFKPFDNNLMEAFPISSRVNSPMNDDVSVTKPIET